LLYIRWGVDKKGHPGARTRRQKRDRGKGGSKSHGRRGAVMRIRQGAFSQTVERRKKSGGLPTNPRLWTG